MKNLIIFTTLFLNSCAVVTVGAVGAAAGTTAIVATDPRSSSVILNDNTIETILKSKYSKKYPSSNIYVNCYDGVVLITGQIINQHNAIKNIEFIAKSTPGVNRIYNYVEERLPQSFVSRSQDSLITTQIKTQLLKSTNINSNETKIITTNKVVYLFGIVTKQNSKTIADIAANISNVTRVITLFEYIY